MGPPIYIGGNHSGRLTSIGASTASMGPPIYIGGNRAKLVALTVIDEASMGPPIYIGGNHPIHRNKSQTLQTASMGPPIYIGGNPDEEEMDDLDKWLQWGHRFTSVETGYERTKEKDRKCFNGATDLHRWKP